MKTASIISLVVGIVLLVCIGFVAFLAIKAGIDGVSFVDSWNSLWGIVPADPTLPIEPTGE